MNATMFSHLGAIQTTLVNLPSVAFAHLDVAAGAAALDFAMTAAYDLLPPQIKASRVANAVYTGLERVSNHYYFARTINSAAAM